MLTADQKTELDKWVQSIEVEVSELPSYHYDSNPYGLDYPLSCGSGQGVWDENEEYETQKEKAIELLETDGGVAVYFGWGDDDDESDKLTKEAIEYIKKG